MVDFYNNKVIIIYMRVPNEPQKWKIEWYVDNRGANLVLDYVNGLINQEQAKIRNHLRLLREFGVKLGMPQAKPISGHKPLWELRPFPNRLIYFAHTGHRFIILHAFRKKQQKIPKKEIAIAKQRLGIERER